MNGTAVFELLLEHRKVALQVSEDYSIASLRVHLIRKFKDYQDQMDKLGFLEEDLAKAVVSLEVSEDGTVATFYLRRRQRKAVSYVILNLPATAGDNLSESDGAV